MNQILSLPEKSIKRIVEQNKVLLVLKKYPSNFNHKKDVFIIEEETTGQIFGTIKVAGVYWRKQFFRFLLRWATHVAFIDGSLTSYMFSKKGFYVFQCYSYVAYK